MTVRVSTTAFEFAHGHKPRGRGWWVFLSDTGSLRVPDSLYSDAKRKAVKHFGALHVDRIEVGS